MTSESTRPGLSRGPVGGAAGESGSVHRAGITALAIVFGLRGEPASLLATKSAPVRVTLEGDSEIDDLDIELGDGAHAFVQAKRSGTLGKPLRETAAQWVQAWKAGTLTPRDTAVMAVAEASGTLRALADALNARRSGSALTGPQRDSLQTLTKLLQTDLDADAVSGLLDIAHVAIVDGSPDSLAMDAAAGWLDGTVVKAGHGHAAIAALRARVPALAADHGTAGLDEWRGWLREALVPAHADPEGVLAARREAATEALTDYRVALAQQRDVLPLTSFLSADPLAVPGLADGLRVRRINPGVATTTQRATDADGLLELLRREGRLLLKGQPGAGKSVAVRQIAAHLAASEVAPVPIVLTCKALSELLPETRSTPLQVHELIELATTGYDAVLRGALEACVDTGHALILLDALDECGEARDRVIDALKSLLDSLSPNLDMVLTTRHSAAEAATRLGFLQAELETPQDLEDTTGRLLRHLGPEAGPDAQREWFDRHDAYIRQSRQDEPKLWAVPLLATLAVLLLTERGPEQMPRTRAQLLVEVVRDSVRRWSTRRADATLPGLDSAMSASVLIDTFADLAGAVADGGDWDLAHHRVSERLRQHWSLADGPAGVVANAVLDHWDLTAGVFVTAAPQGKLTARTRLFTEIGEAQLHTRGASDPSEWLGRALQDAERRETARLAAGLSGLAAACLVELAVGQRGDDLDLACAAWRDGVAYTSDDERRLIAAQLERLAGESTDQQPRPEGVAAFLSDRASPFMRLAVSLAQLPLTDAEVAHLCETCSDRLPSRDQAVIAALAAANRESLNPVDVDKETLDLLEEALVREDEVDEDGRLRPGLELGRHGFGPLVEASLRILVDARPETASAIARTAYRSTVRTFDRVARDLGKRGLGEAAAQVRPRNWARFAAAFSRDEPYQPFVLLRTGLSEAPAKLTPSQAWHLDEAGALIAGLNTGESSVGDLSHAAEVGDVTIGLIGAFTQAAGLDPAIIAGQLAQLASENPDNPRYGLLFRDSRRLSVQSLAVTAEHLQRAMQAMRTGNPWLINVALDLYLHARQLPDEHVEELMELLEEGQLTALARRDVAIALSVHTARTELDVNDAAVRAGVAMVAAQRSLELGRPEELDHLLSDPDLWVRASVAQVVHEVPDTTSAHLSDLLAAPAECWTCVWCDELRDAAQSSCPEPRRHARPVPRLGAPG